MTAHKSFKNPPITEAILDIKVNLPKDITVSSLEDFQKDIQVKYPIKELKTEWKADFKIKPGHASVLGDPIGGPIGYMFANSDKTKVVQARLDGYSFNKLKPYGRWDDFIKEAMLLWEHYKVIATPTSINRLALRYINNIEIPLPVKDFKHYIKTLPDMTHDIPHGLTNYFMRISMVNQETNNKANITTVINPSLAKKSTCQVILDIETIRDIKLETNSNEITRIFESLRDYKNSLFIENISEQTEKLFDLI